MPTNNFNSRDFGLKIGNLYEIIATTYSITEDGSEIKPNASCMGIRIDEENQIQITPFASTSTYKNLKKNSIIAINFVNDVYLYALAALKEQNSLIGLTEFPPKYYAYKYLDTHEMDVPYIKKAWGILIGEVSQEFQKTKQDDFGEVVIPLFKLNIIFWEKFKESFKIFNRAENLALETIILATRLKLAKKMNEIQLFNKIHEKIIDYIENIKRFGKNKKALNTIDLVNKYISHFID
ncbi:MAG: DUF447 family protein [Promethearchaeota archaeon]|nr:MAG: DUF447 family protein [Candidatus Lokiarchaeota archaeon]